MRRLIPILALSGAPQLVLAHGQNDAQHWWTFDPWVWIPMLLVTLLYVQGMWRLRSRGQRTAALGRQAMTAFVGGMLALFLALLWPFDALSSISFAAHMTQHMLLMAVAAPLLILAQPALLMVAALPAPMRKLNSRLGGLYRVLQLLARPRIAFMLHGAIIWIWHIPLLFEAALQRPWLHTLEHFAFFGSALLFWTGIRNSGRSHGEGYGAAAMWVLATLMHTGLLGALITFAPRPLYGTYADIEGAAFSQMEDQQLAGLLMWIPAGLCYLIAGLLCAAAWLRSGMTRENP